MVGTDTVDRLLDVAERLCQTRGYNGFSYRDLSDAVGIKTASIHYHFPTKGDLGKALVVRYRQQLETARLSIERQESTSAGRLRRLFAVLTELYKDSSKICLAAMLAAEIAALPADVAQEVRRFFEENEAWLARQIEQGARDGELRPVSDPAGAAKAIFATLEGAILAARALNDPSRICDAGTMILENLIRVH
jgi:TetR/AcrR family transcriptional repressor of nem operon